MTTYAGWPSERYRAQGELLDANRRYYDSLWAGARLVEPQRFNTWPLVQSLLPQGGSRLGVAAGLRPRLPLGGAQFVDIILLARGFTAASRVRRIPAANG